MTCGPSGLRMPRPDGRLAHADPERELIYIAEPLAEPVTELRAYQIEDLLPEK